ncbi:beta-ketoacyl synthase N-terminal-like domain-containing protein [Actinokineospora terrae]|uniref:Acyl transferase domain-containing protein n=1 Tax=Actinokineospora terrae TaxID=155974 RepID=A0A1H9XRK8_9PSEU|nr:beta-ketoacyl synthase N-terminal-like domain-containing protein [Actinokineospora terrae]SES48778.1 Acyl transferase domain-containing protein [Actinokineospora terrae]
MPVTEAEREPVAVVGMAVMLPGAPDLDTYWHNLRTGYDAITDVPADRRDPHFHAGVPDPTATPPPDRTYCHRGGFLAPFTIDAAGLGIVPNAVDTVEPDQLLSLRVAAAAVADAGGARALGDRNRVGVILGRGGYIGPRMVGLEHRVRTVRTVLRVLAELSPGLGAAELEVVRAALLEPLGPVRPESMINLVPNLAASRIANRLDLRGPAYTVDAACASSLLAVDQAVGELAANRCDAVLAGGVYHGHDDTFWAVFSQLRALSPSQRIRPLSATADGLLIGEGAGVVVLRRLADAQRDGNRVYAVIRGVGSASDGRTQSLFNPDTAGQRTALLRAWSAAGLDPTAPDAVGMVEAHSTGTPVGDAAELTALAEVFGAPPGACAVIGSVKSMIGHTMPAAGIAGLVKAVLAIHHGVLLPTLHCADPNPLLERTRFHTIDTAKPWEGVEPRRAAVNAFGFGGINAHVVLEQHVPPRRAAPARVAGAVRVDTSEPVLRLAADDPAELTRLLDAVERGERVAPTGGRFRLGLVGPTERRISLARRLLTRAGRPGWSWGTGDVWFTGTPLLREPGAKTAFVYPGLEAGFAPKVDDIAALLGETAPSTDTATVARHVAAVADVGMLLHRALTALGVRPDGVAGHSIGEWTAAVASDTRAGARPVIGLDGFPMPEVDYLALGCSIDDATAGIADEPHVVVSHDNAPRQTVLCGPRAALGRLATRFRAAGVIARPLPFATGFHTPMMRPYLAPYLTAIAEAGTRPGALPVWSATTVDRYPDDPAALLALAEDFLVRPVRFRELVERMYAEGYRVFVHMGAGQLGSFVADTLGDRPHLVINAASATRPGIAQLRRLTTALWVHGAHPDESVVDVSPARSGVPVRVSAPVLTVAESARGLLDRRAVPAAPGGVAAELSALVAETEGAVRAVVAATTAPPAVAAVTGTGTGAAAGAGPDARVGRTRVSVRDMPYLRGHRFFRQRPDWPDESDYRPVVPATTLVEWARQAAEREWPAEVVIAVRDIRFTRWLVAAPAREVEIRLERAVAGGSISVRIGEFATMSVEVAASYPRATGSPLEPGPVVGQVLTPSTIYGGRQMFHGPRFQGLTGIASHDGGLASGRVTVLPAPGAVLDNVGQLLGCWLQTRADRRVLAFPVRVAAITFHGPPPPVGAEVDCVVRPRVPDDTAVEMDAEVRHGDRVWARITGWHDIRLDCDHADHAVYAFPRDNALSRPLADGWWSAQDRWTTVASRDVFAGVYLNAPERAEYAEVPPRERRTWLLGRIAAKDAVRDLLPDRLFPAQIRVTGDGDRLLVRGHHTPSLPRLRVELARGAAAVSARVERTTGDV